MWRGAAYYPEHRDPECWEQDLDLMASARVNAVRVGEFAWKRFEPAAGVHDFEWLDRVRDLAAARGIGLLLCPPLRTPPSWLVEKDPSLLIEREDGVRLEFGSRYTVCINHPLLLTAGRTIADVLAARYGDDPTVIGWHLDNEHGDEPDCHCPVCRTAFHDWCRRRYGDIDTLNRNWGTVFWGLEFDAFEQVPTPRATKAFHGPGHLLAWRRFRADCITASVAMQAEAVRAHARPEQFVTTNQQAWNPRPDPCAVARHLDVSGLNCYPPYRDGGRGDAWAMAQTRGYKRANVLVLELRNGAHMIPGSGGNTPAPGEIEHLAMHCVAHGADGLFFFRWRACPFGAEQTHGALTDYDGRPQRAFREAQSVFARLGKLAPLLDGTTPPRGAALLYEPSTRWIMEAGGKWDGPPKLYLDHCRRLFYALRRRNLTVDVISSDKPLEDYPLLVVPMLAACGDEMAARLARYVETGGCLVWHPLSGVKNEEAALYTGRLHPRLRDLLGVEVSAFATTDGEVPFTWQDTAYTGGLFCDLPEVLDAEAVGRFHGDWFDGTPAVTRRRSGKGLACYVMTFAEERFYDDYFSALLPRTRLRPLWKEALPPGVEIAARDGKDGDRLLFLFNGTGKKTQVNLRAPVTDAESGASRSGRLGLNPLEVVVLRDPSAAGGGGL